MGLLALGVNGHLSHFHLGAVVSGALLIHRLHPDHIHELSGELGEPQSLALGPGGAEVIIPQEFLVVSQLLAHSHPECPRRLRVGRQISLGLVCRRGLWQRREMRARL